jgi:hypothetical protein
VSGQINRVIVMILRGFLRSADKKEFLRLIYVKIAFNQMYCIELQYRVRLHVT